MVTKVLRGDGTRVSRTEAGEWGRSEPHDTRHGESLSAERDLCTRYPRNDIFNNFNIVSHNRLVYVHGFCDICLIGASYHSPPFDQVCQYWLSEIFGSWMGSSRREPSSNIVVDAR